MSLIFQKFQKGEKIIHIPRVPNHLKQALSLDKFGGTL